VPTYSPPDPDDDICETATATICTYTESFGVVAKRPADKPTAIEPTITPAPEVRAPFEEHLLLEKRDTTTATSTVSFCTVVTGCGASDFD
jgi:hypothetical protein